jgi:hypothetical protein
MAKLELALDSRFARIWCGYRYQTGILNQGGPARDRVIGSALKKES